jgi:hypothetical protein
MEKITYVYIAKKFDYLDAGSLLNLYIDHTRQIMFINQLSSSCVINIKTKPHTKSYNFVQKKKKKSFKVSYTCTTGKMLYRKAKKTQRSKVNK